MRTEDITSVTHHRDRLRDHLNQVKSTGRPLFITNRSGQTEAVLIGPDAYDQLMEELELARSLKAIDQGMTDAQADRGKDFREAVEGIADQLGLDLKS